MKSKNGNGWVRYSIKESLDGLHSKVDVIQERLLDGDKKFMQLETRQKTHDRMIWGLISALAALLGLTLKLTGVV